MLLLKGTVSNEKLSWFLVSSQLIGVLRWRLASPAGTYFSSWCCRKVLVLSPRWEIRVVSPKSVWNLIAPSSGVLWMVPRSWILRVESNHAHIVRNMKGKLGLPGTALSASLASSAMWKLRSLRSFEFCISSYYPLALDPHCQLNNNTWTC